MTLKECKTDAERVAVLENARDELFRIRYAAMMRAEKYKQKAQEATNGDEWEENTRRAEKATTRAIFATMILRDVYGEELTEYGN